MLIVLKPSLSWPGMLDPSLLQRSSLARYSEPKRWNFFIPVLTGLSEEVENFVRVLLLKSSLVVSGTLIVCFSDRICRISRTFSPQSVDGRV